MDHEKIEWICAGALAIASYAPPRPYDVTNTPRILIGAVIGSHVHAFEAATGAESAAACDLFRERYCPQ